MDKNEIISFLKIHKEEITKRYGVKKIGVILALWTYEITS